MTAPGSLHTYPLRPARLSSRRARRLSGLQIGDREKPVVEGLLDPLSGGGVVLVLAARRNGRYRSWLLTELARPYARGHARPAHRGLWHSSRNHAVINVPWQVSQSPDHDHASPGNHL